MSIQGWRQVGLPTTPSDADAVMKNYYADDTNLLGKMYEGSQTVRTIKRNEAGQGKSFIQPYKVGTSNGVSADFEKAYKLAVDQAVGPSFEDTQFTYDDFFAHWSMNIKQKRQMPAVGRGSFINVLRRDMDSTLERLQRVRLRHVFADGNGEIGKVLANATGPNTGIKFKLTSAVDTIYFEVGTQLEAAATATATAAKKLGSVDVYFKVTKLDRLENEITCALIDDNGVAIAAGNGNSVLTKDTYLFQKGDITAIPTNGTRRMPGFAAWCPETIAANDNFWGMNRSRDRNRLGGVVHAVDTGDPLRQYQNTFIDAAHRQRTLGGRFRQIVMNPLHFKEFVKELGKDTEYKKVDTSGFNKGVPGFRAIQIAYSLGDLMIHQDIHCPTGIAWGYVPSDWQIISLGKFIQTWGEDGRVVDRVQGKNQVTGAMHSYATMICKNPLNLARIKLPALP